MDFNPRLAPHMTRIPSNPIFSLLPKLNEPDFISFAAGAPDADTFPRDDLKKILDDLMTLNPNELLQYGSTEGYPQARRAMARLISRYGLSPAPEEIFITTGGQQSIDIICKLFIEPGDVVLVESPTYSATLQILKSYRAHAISLKADGDGYLPEDLENKIKLFKPKFVYLIPTFKNPSGTTIGLERRKAAAEITGRLGVALLEDDPYRDLRYSGKHLPTIKSFDKTGNIIFLTSTSKILCPGLRVGAAYMPKNFAAQMTVAKQAADMHSSTLPQAIVSEFIERGLLEPHIEKLCGLYGKKLNIMKTAITENFPASVKASDPKGGLFIWCTCPEGVNAATLLEQAVRRKVAYIPGEQFFSNGEGKNTFRMNFSNANLDDIAKGVAILGRVLREHV